MIIGLVAGWVSGIALCIWISTENYGEPPHWWPLFALWPVVVALSPIVTWGYFVASVLLSVFRVSTKRLRVKKRKYG